MILNLKEKFLNDQWHKNITDKFQLTMLEEKQNCFFILSKEKDSTLSYEGMLGEERGDAAKNIKRRSIMEIWQAIN